jgi:hypothetical protein
MTLFHFLGLELDQQAALLWQGECLAAREQGKQYALLYRVGDFYAEVLYDIHKSEIVYIKGFNDRSHLIPYGL